MSKKNRLELTVIFSVVLIALTALPVMAEGGGTYPSPYPATATGGLAIAGVQVALLTALIVQAVKDYFKIEGSTARFTAVVVGFVLSAVAIAIQEDMLTGDAVKLISLLVLAVSSAFGSSGLYGLYKMWANDKAS